MTLVINILLASRPPSYNGFIMNYKMNGLDKTIDELFVIIRPPEATMHKDPDHTMVVTRDTGRGTVRSIYLGDMKNGLITVCINKLYKVNRQFHYFTFIGIFDTISIALVLQLDIVNYQNSKEKSE